MFGTGKRPALLAGLGRGNRPARAGLGRRGISRAQARRDREWRRFVRELTAPADGLSPAEDERMLLFLARHSQDDGACEPPAERAAWARSRGRAHPPMQTAQGRLSLTSWSAVNASFLAPACVSTPYPPPSVPSR